MKQETQATIHPLAQFAATLQWSDVPEPVQRRAEDLWVDWFGSVLAGCKARPVASITRFALSQGPAQGPSEVIAHGATSSPMMAALANAAASHFAEQDDVHNGSVFHPAAVVFPPALAVAQSIEKELPSEESLFRIGRRQALVHWQGVAQALRTVPGFKGVVVQSWEDYMEAQP